MATLKNVKAKNVMLTLSAMLMPETWGTQFLTNARYYRKKIEKETVQMMRQIDIWRYLITCRSSSCALACFFCSFRRFCAALTGLLTAEAAPPAAAAAAAGLA